MTNEELIIPINALNGECPPTGTEDRKALIDTMIKLEDNESRISFAIVESTVEDHQSIIYRHKAADLFLNKSDIENSNILLICY